MKPESILHADMLDILFENRNKEYGAYELRKHYNGRLKRAMAAVVIVMILFVGIYYWTNRFSAHKSTAFFKDRISDTVILTTVEIQKPPLQPLPVMKKRIATRQDVVPRIVPDNNTTNPSPTVDELNKTEIGTATIKGDTADGVERPAATASGNEHAAPPEPEREKIFDIAESMPEFPGGMEALRRFLSKNLRMPREDLDPGARIRVMARFVVDKDGRIAGIELVESGGSDFDNEVKRVINKMPQWKPGKQNGHNVAVYYTLPVIFQAPDTEN